MITFTSALLLAVLLNLCGHTFLHLGDTVLGSETTHLSAETPHKGVAPAAHPCSVCQDHQHLALEKAGSLTLSTPVAIRSDFSLSPNNFLSAAYQFDSSRAPPRR